MAATTNPSTMDDDAFVLMLVGVFSWPAIIAAAYWAWSQGGSWLVRHQVLVAAKADPLLTIPGLGGAGLDAPRLLILAGVVVVLMVLTCVGIRSLVARGWRGRQGGI